MRLTQRETAVIREAANRCFGPEAVVRLFGSRLDDRKRGGDIDLYVETTFDDREVALRRIRMLTYPSDELVATLDQLAFRNSVSRP